VPTDQHPRSSLFLSFASLLWPWDFPTQSARTRLFFCLEFLLVVVPFFFFSRGKNPLKKVRQHAGPPIYQVLDSALRITLLSLILIRSLFRSQNAIKSTRPPECYLLLLCFFAFGRRPYFVRDRLIFSATRLLEIPSLRASMFLFPRGRPLVSLFHLWRFTFDLLTHHRTQLFEATSISFPRGHGSCSVRQSVFLKPRG